MSRKIPLVAALVAAALVIPTTAAQAADSGLTPTVSPFTYGDITAGQGYYNWADPIVLTNTTGSDVTLSAGVDTVTSSNDGWGWIGVGGSPYPSCISQSLVVAPGDSCSFVPYVVWQGVLGDTTATLTVHGDQGTTDIPVSANFQASIADYLPKGYFWFPQVVGPAPKTTRSTSRTTGTSTSTQCRSPSLTGSRLNPPSTSSRMDAAAHQSRPERPARSPSPSTGPATGKSAPSWLSQPTRPRGWGRVGADAPIRHDRRPNPPRRSQPHPVSAPLHARRREREHPRRQLHL